MRILYHIIVVQTSSPYLQARNIRSSLERHYIRILSDGFLRFAPEILNAIRNPHYSCYFILYYSPCLQARNIRSSLERHYIRILSDGFLRFAPEILNAIRNPHYSCYFLMVFVRQSIKKHSTLASKHCAFYTFPRLISKLLSPVPASVTGLTYCYSNSLVSAVHNVGGMGWRIHPCCINAVS